MLAQEETVYADLCGKEGGLLQVLVIWLVEEEVGG